MTVREESPTNVAARLNLGRRSPTTAAITYDELLELAVKAYWKRRPDIRQAS